MDGDVRRVKLLDFRIARWFAATNVMTRTGMIVGTPEYVAPEQARGVRNLGPAADFFSRGCILYECLCGEAAGEASEQVLLSLVLAIPPDDATAQGSTLLPSEAIRPTLDREEPVFPNNAVEQCPFWIETLVAPPSRGRTTDFLRLRSGTREHPSAKHSWCQIPTERFCVRNV